MDDKIKMMLPPDGSAAQIPSEAPLLYSGRIFVYRKRDDTLGELYACPFCGGAPTVKHIGNECVKKRKIEISCSECRCRRVDGAITHGFDWLENIATEHWNQRPVR